MTDRERSIQTVLGTDIHTGQAVTLSLKELLLGLYGIGVTGSGKSTLDLNMIIDFIQQGLGLLVIEPHGDLTRNVIAAMPEARLKDVIYLDLTDSTSSFGLIRLQKTFKHLQLDMMSERFEKLARIFRCLLTRRMELTLD